GEGLRAGDVRYSAQPHLLDQPVLKGLVGALHPTLGLRGRGLDEFDPQTLRRPPELRIAVAAGRLLGVDAEYAVTIAVKGQRAPMGENMRPQRAQIGFRRLRRRKLQRRKPARGVVDKHDQRAARAPPLEPVVRTAVDLDQLAKARPAFARRM